MSVAVMVLDEGGPGQHRLVPLATQRLFVEQWLPLCSRLNLRFVPLFESGINLERGDLPVVRSELELLQQHVERHGTPATTWMLERIQVALQVLKEAEQQGKEV